MSDHRVTRICQIADSLTLSNGKDKSGASTGELVAGAFVAGRPEWSGYVHILDALDRLGPDWIQLIISIRRAGYEPPA